MKWVVVVLALLFAGNGAAAVLKVQDQQIVSESPQATVDISYPRTGVEAIDTTLRQWATEQADDFRNVDAEEVGTGSPWSLDIGYEVLRNDGTLFVVEFGIDSYAGGAHPNQNTVTFNFLLPEGAPLDIEQVIAGRKGLQRLSALTVADLKRQLLPEEASDAQWIERGAGPDWSNFESFLLLPKTLQIEFDPYAVGPYSSGPQTVEIPLSALVGALRTDLRAPVPSFDCGNAGSVIEHAICSSTTLARMDRTMARDYRRFSSTSDDANNARVRAAQRAWVSQRNATCGALQAAALEECLAKSYRLRMEALRQPL